MSYCSFYNGLFNVGNKSTITLHDSITHLFFSFSGMNITESNRNYIHMPNIVNRNIEFYDILPINRNRQVIMITYYPIPVTS